ncbi:MAG: hypothetical protein WB974_20315 [Acidobacteriaceae bacterium]
MNPHNRKSAPPPLTDAAFDATLRDDAILPSSGFAASVMAAVQRESAAPAALAFPWKRALPGLIVAIAVLALLFGVLVSAAVRAFHTAGHASASIPAVSLDWHIDLQPLFHNTAPAAIVWVLLALAFSGLTLLLCRRLVSAR